MGQGGGRRYFDDSRAPRYSLLFALPLLLLYEAMAALLPRSATGGVRNGADVMLKSLFALALGPRGPLVFGLLLVAGCALFVGRDIGRHRGPLRGSVFAWMLAESVALALVFGTVVGVLTARLLGVFGALALSRLDRLGSATQLMVSLGAGLYEELLFRVLLVSALAWAARAAFGLGPLAAGAWATLLGALVFSAFHYVGPYGDVLRLQSFVFRAIGGVFFSAIYLLRGFGIVAWTHALYDVFLLVL